MLKLSLNACRPYCFRFARNYCGGKTKDNDTALALAERDLVNKAKDILKIFPHQFSSTEAAEKFVQFDSQRWFAPIVPQPAPLLASEESPLKKVLFPFFEAKASVSNVCYDGRYGIERIQTVIVDGKPTFRTYTEWHHMQGFLLNEHYYPQDTGLREYAGKTYYFKLLNEAFKGHIDSSKAVPFDSNQIDAETILDAFVLKEKAAQEIFRKAIWNHETARAEKEIIRRSGYYNVKVDDLSYRYALDTQSVLYPGYLLIYEGQSARVMPALDPKKISVHGFHPISTTKTMVVAGVAATALSLLYPQLIPLRMALGVSALTGLYPTVGPKVQGLWGDFRTYLRGRKNAASTEGESDALRKAATQPKMIEVPKIIANEASASPIHQMDAADLKHYERLGLDPCKPLSEDDIHMAFNAAIKKVHPDLHKGYGSEEAQKTIEAMRALLQKVS